MGGASSEFLRQLQSPAVGWSSSPGLWGMQTASMAPQLVVPEQTWRGLIEGMQLLADQLAAARSELERLRREVESANARVSREAEDSLASLKSTIVAELQASREPVFPGSLAIKYNLDYGTVIRAIKELRDSGVID